MTRFKFVGTHQEDLASGEILTPGQEINLNAEALGEDRNKQLIDDGKLIKMDEQQDTGTGSGEELTGDALDARAKELDIKNRSKMSAEELRAAIKEAEEAAGNGEPDAAAESSQAEAERGD